jgi:alcohol dehydrogenase class IV
MRLIENHAADKMERVAEAMGLNSSHEVPNAIKAFKARVGLPASLRELGYPLADLDEMALDATNSFFNASSPYHPTPAEYKAIIQEITG